MELCDYEENGGNKNECRVNYWYSFMVAAAWVYCDEKGQKFRGVLLAELYYYAADNNDHYSLLIQR